MAVYDVDCQVKWESICSNSSVQSIRMGWSHIYRCYSSVSLSYLVGKVPLPAPISQRRLKKASSNLKACIARYSMASESDSRGMLSTRSSVHASWHSALESWLPFNVNVSGRELNSNMLRYTTKNPKILNMAINQRSTGIMADRSFGICLK